ncbi:DUF262 domain-containing protein [Nitratiruptor sp. SB155-2]|uniref:DUF262 domain-containing protein n=1 Tax=Nitratiruptor sp. (strain SB155-2) TaxID=387092 RepID=UPI000158740A|nr:DUF262 domain-containing protein [Nitratiruptor sp. SB155-2]BAF70784.1 conserved hypothetical protein [Nitratiruptor sp. SB155-2]
MKGGLNYNETKFVDTNVKKLVDLITNLNLTVPPHQRDYSWEREEIEEFLDDVDYLMSQDFNSIEALPHFLGAFVFIENNEDKSYEIIDGQQRITTTMLYFNAIRLLAKKYIKGEDISTILARCHEYIYKSRPGQEVKLRLKLGRADDFFNKLLKADKIEDISKIFNSLSKKRDVDIKLYNAFEIIYSHIESNIKDDLVSKKLLKYIEAVQTMMVAIEIVVQQPGIAYIIFETLNARGKELSAANLIKNELLKYAEKQNSFDNVLNIWSMMVEEITQYEKADITDFLINSYWSNFKYIPQTSLFSGVKELLEEITAKEYAETIENDYLNYTKIAGFNKSVDSKFSKKVISTLEDLNDFLNIRRIYPLLLAGAYKLDNNDFEKLVIKSVNFAFRYKTVLNKSADTLVKLSSNLAIKLRKNEITLNEIYEIFRKEASDSDFKTAFTDFRPGTNKLGFYVIRKIEDYLSQGQGVKVLDQSPNQHLEHILPKRPTQIDWPNIFNGDEIDDRFNIYVNKIGNLTVLEKDINQYIKNKSFSFKNSNDEKKDYQHSVLKLPKKIQNYLVDNKWNFESIDKRGEDLAKLAVDVWAL